jgi:hypothetical protein
VMMRLLIFGQIFTAKLKRALCHAVSSMSKPGIRVSV